MVVLSPLVSRTQSSQTFATWPNDSDTYALLALQRY